LPETQPHATGLAELRRERQHLKAKAKGLANAIAETRHSLALLAKLGEVDAQIRNVDRAIAEMRESVFQNVMQLRKLLRDTAAGKSKAAMARHIGQLTLTPRETQKGPIYDVNRAFDLLNENDVMPMVARDGYPQHSTLLSVPLVVYLDRDRDAAIGKSLKGNGIVAAH
jgi:hypothetical protein